MPTSGYRDECPRPRVVGCCLLLHVCVSSWSCLFIFCVPCAVYVVVSFFLPDSEKPLNSTIALSSYIVFIFDDDVIFSSVHPARSSCLDTDSRSAVKIGSKNNFQHLITTSSAPALTTIHCRPNPLLSGNDGSRSSIWTVHDSIRN